MILGCQGLECDNMGFKTLWSQMAWASNQMTFDYLGAWTWWYSAHCRTCLMYGTYPQTPSHDNILLLSLSLSQNS